VLAELTARRIQKRGLSGKERPAGLERGSGKLGVIVRRSDAPKGKALREPVAIAAAYH
jgi:hypothetical protein